jgi:hypothetical protein
MSPRVQTLRKLRRGRREGNHTHITILSVCTCPRGFQVNEFSDLSCIRRKSHPSGHPLERHARDRKRHFDVSATSRTPVSIVPGRERLRAQVIWGPTFDLCASEPAPFYSTLAGILATDISGCATWPCSCPAFCSSPAEAAHGLGD